MKSTLSLFVFSIICFMQMHAQTPATDPHWKLYWSDEFNYPANKQDAMNGVPGATWKPFKDVWCLWRDAGKNGVWMDDASGDNLTFTGSTMIMSAKKLPNSVTVNAPCQNSTAYSCWCDDATSVSKTVDFSGVCMTSKKVLDPRYPTSTELKSFKYGYYELKFKLPDLQNDVLWKDRMKGTGFSYWLFPVDPVRPHGKDAYDEIDIFEFFYDYAIERNQPYLFVPSIHYMQVPIRVWDSNLNQYVTKVDNSVIQDHKYNGYYGLDGAGIFRGISTYFNYQIIDFSQFHTIGFEWRPENLSIYIDGEYHTSMDFFQNEMSPMNIIMAVGMDDKSTANRLNPFNMEVDYVRYYYLDQGLCDNPVKLDVWGTAFNFNTPIWNDNIDKAYQYVALHGKDATDLVKVPAATPINLRAREYIYLDEWFECDDAAGEFNAIVTQE